MPQIVDPEIFNSGILTGGPERPFEVSLFEDLNLIRPASLPQEKENLSKPARYANDPTSLNLIDLWPDSNQASIEIEIVPSERLHFSLSETSVDQTDQHRSEMRAPASTGGKKPILFIEGQNPVPLLFPARIDQRRAGIERILL